MGRGEGRVSLMCGAMKLKSAVNAVFISKPCGVFDQERGCSRQTPEAVRATPQFLLHFCRPSTSQVLPVAFFPFAHMKSATREKERCDGDTRLVSYQHE